MRQRYFMQAPVGSASLQARLRPLSPCGRWAGRKGRPRLVERQTRISTSLRGQFAQAALQEPALRLLARKFQRPLVRRPGICGPTEAPAQIGPCRMREVILAQFPTVENAVDQRQTC